MNGKIANLAVDNAKIQELSADRITVEGDTIVDVEWIVPEPLTLETQANTVTCRVTTENGLVDDRSIDLAIVST